MFWYFNETVTLCFFNWLICFDAEDQLIRRPVVGVKSILASLPWTTLNLSILLALWRAPNNFLDDFSNSSLLSFSSASSRYILPINSVNWTFLFSPLDLRISLSSSSILLDLAGSKFRASAPANRETVLSSKVAVELFLFPIPIVSTEIGPGSCLEQFSQVCLGSNSLLEEELRLPAFMEPGGAVF